MTSFEGYTQQSGTLVVGRLKGNEEMFVVFLLDVRDGRLLESSNELAEADLRNLLSTKFGESESQINERISLANSHPGV